MKKKEVTPETISAVEVSGKTVWCGVLDINEELGCNMIHWGSFSDKLLKSLGSLKGWLFHLYRILHLRVLGRYGD